MKKLLALLLVFVMLFAFVACGKSISEPSDTKPFVDTKKTENDTEEHEPEPEELAATPIKLGESIDNDSFKMSFDSIQVLPEFNYSTGEYSSTSLYVEDNYQLLILQGKFENKSTSTISSSIFYCKFTVNGDFVKDGTDVRFNFMRSKYFEVDAYSDPCDYCIYINIPNKLAEIYKDAVIQIGFNKDLSNPVTSYDSNGQKSVTTDLLYEINSASISDVDTDKNENDAAASVDNNTVSSSEIELKPNEAVTTKDFVFTLNNVELTYEVKPANTNGVYSSYTAENGKIFVHIDGYYNNTSKRDACIRDLPVATVTYDNDYTYNGFAIVDDGDNRFDWVSSYVICTPLETCHYHCVVECPDLIESGDAPLYFTIKLGDNTYKYNIR